jgi:hypothetical protein
LKKKVNLEQVLVDNSFHLSDPHRFNKTVKYDEENKLFIKPRPVNIESLFLASEIQANPIRTFLKYDFNYRVSTSSSWLGKCEEVRSSINPNFKLDIDSISKLLALSTFVGITDLHSENLKCLPKNNHLSLVPIDIETILFKCESAIDTALIPSMIAPEKFGFNQNDCNLLLQIPIIEFIDSFYESSIQLIDRLKSIWDFLNINLCNVPIRIILKSTLEYYEYLKGEKSLDSFFIEEIFQLKNKDIPYFFTYLGDSNIYYFDTPDSYTKVLTPGFSNSNNFIFSEESDFLNKERLDNLLQVSLLQILNICRENLSTVKKTKHFIIKNTDSNISIEGPTFIIESDV